MIDNLSFNYRFSRSRSQPSSRFFLRNKFHRLNPLSAAEAPPVTGGLRLEALYCSDKRLPCSSTSLDKQHRLYFFPLPHGHNSLRDNRLPTAVRLRLPPISNSWSQCDNQDI